LASLDISNNQLVSTLNVDKMEVTGSRSVYDPIRLGNMVEYQGSSFKITCVYSSGNVDLLDVRCIIAISNAIQDMGSLSKLKLDQCELAVVEIKTATALDLSDKGLRVEDAIVIAALIKVRAIAKSCWTD
jgi:hypothetical protein